MDVQRFLAEFGHIANAPGGVAQLRELILQLAVGGLLSENEVGDTPAANSIDENLKLQRSLVAERRMKRQHAPAPIDEKNGPWLIPDGWSWTRLGAITNYGDAPKVDIDDVNEETWVLELEDIEKDSSKLLNRVFARERKFKSTKNWFPQGAVLYGKLRPYLDKVVIADIAGVCTTEISPISFFSGIDAAYLRWYLKCPYFIKYASSSTYGMNLPRLGTDAAREAPFPFPPKQEQTRIVAKVDELMALCDRLEAQQQQRRSLQIKLLQSTLQTIAKATSTQELQTSWGRLAGNFDQLFDVSEDVTGFKGLILDLAVSGQLLKREQRSTATATELLEAISAARVAWSKACQGQEQKEALNMLKKLRTQQVASTDAVLPDHWAWATLLQVSQAVVDCHNKTAPYVGTGIHLIRTTDIRNGKMELANTRKISEETYAYWSRRLPPRAGDIFFTREAPMGEAAIVPEGQQVCLGQRSMLIRLFPDLFSNRFLLFVIQSPSFQSRMVEVAIGMTVKHLRVGGVEQLLVPVPPKSEQDRIVAIVDQLFQMCDHLADQLSKKKTVAAQLAQSAVAVITGIDIDSEKEEPLKAPQTELIAPLRLGQAPDIKAQAPLATILAHHSGELAAKDLWQRFGGDIEAFYAQLKQEVEQGWIQQPTVAEMREKAAG